ncbi:HEAT repeat domain-containing protein [Niabella beijingensis]|uniref:HEAT repeat domain-containing protein n=1 Tax=Niabella beijingensis TaxID=2872700 RepID=UPI001CBF2FDE|nr:HEAT repeat domain-containing protein [Niabella beijingensis]MBZ4188329.1 HEAT repeat domain-containing protein [Niabella beijingensis]
MPVALLNLLQYEHYPIVIQVALWVSLTAISGFILVHLVLFYRRLSGYFLNRRKKKLIAKFENLSLPHLVLNPNLGKVPVREISLPLNDYISLGIYKSSHTRIVFTEYLMQLSDAFSGNVHLLIRKLYNDLRLGRHAQTRLRSGKRDIILGLHELTYFNVVVKDDTIFRLINHSDKLIRQEATCYALKLFPEPLEIFSSIKAPFSEWAHVEYFEIIKSRNDIEIPGMGRWIQPGGNKSVMLLCLDLAVYFQQVETADAILALLPAADTGLKRKLVNALGKLFDPSHAAELEQLYAAEPELPVKTEILKALGRMGNEASIPFLQEVFRSTGDIVLKKHAAYSLYHMNVNRAALVPLYEDATAEDKVVLSYIQNPIIKYI